MIKNIIFDLNRTLVKTNYKKFDKFLKKFDIGADLFGKIFYSHIFDYNQNKFNTRGLFERILRDLNVDKKFLDEIKAEYERSFVSVRGMRGVLRRLKRKHRLFILTGEGKELLDLKMNRLKLRDFFEEIYASCYEGFLKKDPRLYKRLIKKSSVNPKESLFIDDTPLYVEVAKKLGFKTILFKDAKQLREELKRLKINL